MKSTYLIVILIVLSSLKTFSQNSDMTTLRDKRFSLSTPWLTFANFGEESKNTHHYEFHLKYQLTTKDRIGIKLATWKLFEPMGIPLWDPLLMKESEFYPGRLRENGLGLIYQRFLWKGLFTTIEVMPQLKTYFDENNRKIDYGFKLYTSYHLGYHISLFKDRVFLEPQVHCQYWPVDTNIPQGFKEKEDQWNNFFLFEPNLYLGINF